MIRPLARLAVATLVVGCVPPDAGPPRVGDPLPELQARTLDGEDVRLDQLRGEAVLLNLWATWCPPCRAEMPYFQELSDAYGPRGLRVVGLSVDNAGARDLVEGFLEASGVEYEILLDPGMASMDRLEVLGLPATFLIDPGGVIRHMRMGPVAEGDTVFLRQIEAVLPGATP